MDCDVEQRIVDKVYHVQAVHLTLRAHDREAYKSQPDWQPAHSLTPHTTVAYRGPVDREVLLYQRMGSARCIAVMRDLADADHPETSVYIFSPQRRPFACRQQRAVMTLPVLAQLASYDDGLRCLSIYDHRQAAVTVYRFEEDYNHHTRTARVELDSIFRPSPDATHGGPRLAGMTIVGALKQLVLMSDEGEVAMVDILKQAAQPMRVRASGPMPQCVVTVTGPMLLLITPLHTDTGEHNFQADVYLLSNTAPCFKPVRVGQCNTLLIPARFSANTGFCIGMLGPQEHLVGYDAETGHVRSMLLQITTERVSSHLVSQRIQQGCFTEVTSDDPLHTSNGRLDILFRVFDKFSPGNALGIPVPRAQLVVLKQEEHVSREHEAAVGGVFTQYVESLLRSLSQNVKKDVAAIRGLTVREATWREYGLLEGWAHSATISRSADAWVADLICLVPIQIARALNNELKALSDGAPVMIDNLRDVDDLASEIRFGLYEPLLRHLSDLPVVVVSSMGAQSTGKSYLFNHIGGTHFDVSGGRCTDGCWLSMRVAPERVVVLLDLEGMGSFERTEQEDMLLGLLGSALSSITFFKTHFQFDRYLHSSMRRLGVGASKCKSWTGRPQGEGSSSQQQSSAGQLFRGMLYMILKDVQSSAAKEVQTEFRAKLSQCMKEHDNFLATLFNNQAGINCFPLFGQERFFTAIDHLGARVMRHTAPTYSNPSSFLSIAKLVLAKLEYLDWSAVDKDRIRQRISTLAKSVGDACATGIQQADAAAALRDIDRRTDIPDPRELQLDLEVHRPDVAVIRGRPDVDVIREEPITEGTCCVTLVLRDLPDAGLRLGPTATESDSDEALLRALHQDMRQLFSERVYAFTPQNMQLWLNNLTQTFVPTLVERRRRRVTQWLSANITTFADTQPARTFSKEVYSYLEACKRAWRFCDALKCAECFLACVLPAHHTGPHDCTHQGHKCIGLCAFCSSDPQSGSSEDTDGVQPAAIVAGCLLPAGHADRCNCKDPTHVCGRPCHLSSMAAGCSGTCQKAPGHEESSVSLCECATKVHLCGKTCDLPGCDSTCILPYDQPHGRHKCHRISCPQKCPLCNDTCSEQDHFHAADNPTASHLCGRTHTCPNLCQAEGVCSRQLVRMKELQQYKGQRTTFEYHVTEFEAVRMQCCKSIPVGALSHEGPCVHDENPAVVHTCAEGCPNFAYPCELPSGHAGLHTTTHGNMRLAKFVGLRGDTGDLDLDVAANRLYRAGDLAGAENCDIYCMRAGRGHHHVLKCNGEQCKRGIDAIRHAPGYDTECELDEVMHETYCDLLGWQDWCSHLSAEDRSAFHLCPYVWPHPSHTEHVMYCRLPLWHAPVGPSTVLPPEHAGCHPTRGGHVFPCTHRDSLSYRIYLIVDRSGSMGDTTVRPTLPWLTREAGLNNKLGAVIEAIHHFISTRHGLNALDRVSLVSFDSSAALVVDDQPLDATFTQRLVQSRSLSVGGGTYFVSGMAEAYKTLMVHRQVSGTACPVCQSATMRTPCRTACQHLFCQACIESWLLQQASCPSCRAPANVGELTLLHSVPVTFEAMRGPIAGSSMRERPLVLLLSDGYDQMIDATPRYAAEMRQLEESLFPDCTCWQGGDGVSSCASSGHRLVGHTVGFGDNAQHDHLSRVAAGLEGSYQRTMEDLPSLCQAFVNLAEAPDKKGKTTVSVMPIAGSSLAVPAAGGGRGSLDAPQ